jgi:hypothetical protein
MRTARTRAIAVNYRHIPRVRYTSRTRLLRARCILFFLAAVLYAVLYAGLSSQLMSTRLLLALSTGPLC